ncbi:MAG: hypothetical protein A2622_08595 [Bdellovibrionales bacterium RIFCSPHIGHO2_01_FULL_40_29]|nr:MAG: hypothetical protein A2622_08595 [Bdellovibrionales bacterium RIFCSPHIGHO2_01_FULL_40_29]OFZ35547.1 MAG: hypothetical protein A3D17_07830 [Bdellovibrionales bacterium RIFCSPHIGHO2_02_FULL_40_15]
MNSLISFSPAILGIAVVLQAGLNKKIAAQWGLTTAVLLNALVFAVVAIIFYSLSVWRMDWFPVNMKANFDSKTFLWWYIIPGILGCVLVFGGPWAVARWGAVHTFIIVISAQLLASLIWDWQVENLPVSTVRIAGIGLSWIGAFLVCKS